MTKFNKNDIVGFVTMVIAIPISALIAVFGNMMYSSGMATGFGFAVVIGFIVEFIGFSCLAASGYIWIKSMAKEPKDLKNKKVD